MLTKGTMPITPSPADPTFDAFDAFNTFDTTGLNDFTIPAEDGPQFDIDIDDPMFNVINFDAEFQGVEEVYPVLERMLDKHTVNMNLPVSHDPAAASVTMSPQAANEMEFTMSFLPGLYPDAVNRRSQTPPQTINPAVLSVAQPPMSAATNTASSVNAAAAVNTEQSRQTALNDTPDIDSSGNQDGTEAMSGPASD
jgi:hypothetical protein